MGFLDFITGKKEPPKVKGATFGGFSITYNLSFEVFFNYFKNNPYVSNAIKKIMGDIAAHGYELRLWGSEENNDKALAEFEALLQVGTPYDIKWFIERLVRDYELTGNAYIYTAMDGNTIVAIQALDPRYTKPIVNENGTVLGYLQNLNGIRTFTKDEVYHIRDGNDPDNEAIGYSKMNSLFLDLETDKEARESNLAFFKNNQTPASIVLLDPEYSNTDEDGNEDVAFRNKLKEIFTSGANTGGKNAHRSMFLEGVKEIVKIQDKINDMEFIEQRKFTRELVNSAYGMNADVQGVTENSNKSTGVTQSTEYHKAIEQKNIFWGKVLTKVLARINPSYNFVILQDDLTLLAIKSTIAGDLYEKGLLTRNEARDIIQYEEVDEGDTFRVEGSTNNTNMEDDKNTKKKK